MQPYVRFPAIHGNRIAFVAEDDVWVVSAEGGPTRRLTAVQGHTSHPVFSPDGRQLAYLSTREGTAEVYLCDAQGGGHTRLTYGSGATAVCGFGDDGESVIYASAAGRPSPKEAMLWSVPVGGGEPARLPYGLGTALAVDGEHIALARHEDDLARWKRYKGGRMGTIWLSTGGAFTQLDADGARVARPMWLDGRLWFVSDGSYVANLWSCLPDGSELRQETHHDDFAVRHASSDGGAIAYACGARLFRLVPGEEPVEVALDHHAPAERLARRQVSTRRYLQGVDLHPDGRSLALNIRGKAVTIGTFEGAPEQHGARHGTRYRLLRWFADGERLAAASDGSGEEQVIVFADGTERALPCPELGRPTDLSVSPTGEHIAAVDDRNQVFVLPLDGEPVRADHSDAGRITSPRWSSDGQWLVYSATAHRGAAAQLRLFHVPSGAVHPLTDGRFLDTSPSFDPAGRFVAFLSNRDLSPVYDQAFFDVNFPATLRPYLVMLQGSEPTPFRREPQPVGGKSDTLEPAESVDIELDGIAQRLVRVPMRARRYLHLEATLQGLVADSEPVNTGRDNWSAGGAPPARRSLHILHHSTQTEHSGLPRHSGFTVSHNGKALLLRVSDKLRVVPFPGPDKKLPTGSGAGRKTGWFNSRRVSVTIDPRAEWGQMLRESWRWMRDHFWVDDHSGVDWDAAWERYSPLLDRVATRGEYSDLVWLMIGELGTSHAYEMQGDYRRLPGWSVAKLGAEFTWDDGWKIARLAQGDAELHRGTSPLTAPGVGLEVGDVLTRIDGAPAREDEAVGGALIDRGGKRVRLQVRPADGGEERSVVVTALPSDANAWYRAWVRANRERVHRETNGRVGYVHIPDMGPGGYADFHRDYLVECTRDALVVDVRYNRGGHVSQLIMEKLLRRPVGYNIARYDGHSTYPSHAMAGPMVALTNEMAGSDGDIFSHTFKLYGAGPLIGTRTWGGVIGIWPRARHADGGLTTQPEFSFWFEDVGWQVENYGTEPDIEVPVHPEDYAAARDVQLERGLAEIQRLLAEFKGHPGLGERPYLGRQR